MKLAGINKSKLNLSIDILMFVLISAMAGIGFLMKYVVVSGEVRNVKYGNNVDLKFFDLTRHKWGSIHLMISIIFLALLVLHIILHWKLIISILKSMFPSPYIRYGLAGILCLFGSVTIISPFFLEPQKVPFEAKGRNRPDYVHSSENNIKGITERELTGNNQYTDEWEKISDPIIRINHGSAHKEENYSEYNEFEVYGYQTPQYVADKYSVPVAVICRDLKIPANLSKDKLGSLRKRYSFTMTDVRRCISNYKKNNAK